MNLKLIRCIVLRLGRVPAGDAAQSLEFDGHDESTVHAQLSHLTRAGLVEAGSGGHCLSVKGREFLRLASNDILWKRVLGELASGGRTPTLEAVNARMLEWSFMS